MRSKIIWIDEAIDTGLPHPPATRIQEDAMEECDHCGELMCECTCHESDFYDGDL